MSLFPKSLSGRSLYLTKAEKKLKQSFKIITGFSPNNLALYKRAMRHSSVSKYNEHGIKDSYERLEYLGDAVLGMMVAEYLFSQFPFEEEGFLTEIRSKIVNRESLNALGQKIGLREMVKFNLSTKAHPSMYGDCMEALIGAVYLDQGFKRCKKFVILRLLKPHFDVKELVSTITNYKSKLLEWAQKTNQNLRFEIIKEEDKKFTSQVFIENDPKAKGVGYSKKKAEQEAARKTYELLNLG